MDDAGQINSNETFEQAKACAEKAIDLLVRHQVTPLPRNYAVTYEYWAGHNADLTAFLDGLLSAGKPLDEYLLRDLHDRFLNHEREQRFNAMGCSLQNMLLGLLETIKTAGSNAEEYRQKLVHNIEQLNSENDREVLMGVARELLAAAVKAKAQQDELQHNLEATRSEVEQLRNEIEQHRREALIDPLTGLFNRRAMEQLLGEHLASSEDAIAMLVLDIDHFKNVNDTYGHAVGDVVLRHVADAIRKCIRGEDIAVRYGGEEFVILLPRTTLQGAMIVAETLRHRVEEMRLVRRQDNLRLAPITASLGVATRHPEDDQESFFQRADKALYVSKSLGRNRVSAETQSGGLT
jgi:diguanylate cyclase